MKKLLALIVLLSGLSGLTVKAAVADYDVVPMPCEIIAGTEEGFTVDFKTVIAVPKGDELLRFNAELLAGYIGDVTGHRPRITTAMPKKNSIVLSSGLKNDNREAYRITVDRRLIKIDGASAAGCLYGVQTLRKSIPRDAVKGEVLCFPAVTVNDAPRFGYRGSHLDCSRHFFAADSVKTFIDILVLHNINRLHWHLTDDQGWRLEIKKYPRLTEVGSKRNGTLVGLFSSSVKKLDYDGIPYGGYYSQEEVREIVDYAAKRNVTIIPEIDLPGHMVAALTAYPELGCTGGPYEVWQRWGISDDVLCAGNPKVLEFIDDVLDEVMDLFPSEYIHIGGDECPKGRWQECPRCQAKIKELGFTKDSHSSAEQKLQNHVMEHATTTLAARGRKMIGWDEILEGGLFPGANVMAWRSVEAAAKAAKQGYDAVLTPKQHCYLDYTQSATPELEPLTNLRYLPLEQVYALEPISPDLTADESKHILGAQVNLWSEYIPEFWIMMYTALPRMAAIAEVGWSKPETKDYNRFIDRLYHLMGNYDREGYTYCHEVFNPTGAVTVVPNGCRLTLQTIDNAPIYYTLDGSEPDCNSIRYTGPVTLDKTYEIKAVAIRDSVKSRTWSGRVNNSLTRSADVKMVVKSHPKFTHKGASMLQDGVYGTKNFEDRKWIGFGRDGMDVIFDLGCDRVVSRVGFNCLNATSNWVFDCRDASVEVSNDGKEYHRVARAEYEPVDRWTQSQVYHELTFNPQQVRYVRVKATPLMSIPAWHNGVGKYAPFMVDEIEIE